MWTTVLRNYCHHQSIILVQYIHYIYSLWAHERYVIKLFTLNPKSQTDEIKRWRHGSWYFFTMKTFRRLQSIVPIQCENIFLARPSVSQNYIFLPGDLRRKQARWSVKKVHPSCEVSPQVFFFQEMEQNTVQSIFVAYVCQM